MKLMQNWYVMQSPCVELSEAWKNRMQFIVDFVKQWYWIVCVGFRRSVKECYEG